MILGERRSGRIGGWEDDGRLSGEKARLEFWFVGWLTGLMAGAGEEEGDRWLVCEGEITRTHGPACIGTL